MRERFYQEAAVCKAAVFPEMFSLCRLRWLVLRKLMFHATGPKLSLGKPKLFLTFVLT